MATVLPLTWLVGLRIARGFTATLVPPLPTPFQRYDPIANVWVVSGAFDYDVRMPLARAGTGPAVYSHGRFFVFGGETLTNPGWLAHNETMVYSRVDIFNPATGNWSVGPTMPEGKHGISATGTPYGIVLAGGGTTAGRSRSSSVHALRVAPSAWQPF